MLRNISFMYLEMPYFVTVLTEILAVECDK